MMFEDYLKKVVNGEDLEYLQSYECMHEIMRGEVSHERIAGLLTALKMKGETVDEIYAFAKVMRENAIRVDGSKFEILVDTCGTGGDGTNTFNISTTAMFVAAASGVHIAKHGNKSITSKSGAADVLERLGAKIFIENKKVFDCVEKSNVGFMFAPGYHLSMKNVAPVRKELPFRTVFNILGPLSNPAGANVQLMGVFDRKLVIKMASVLNKLGVKRAMVVHGSDGMDEITLTGNTYVAELNNGDIREYEIDPRNFGFDLCKVEDLTGGEPADNAKILLDVLNGEKGSRRDIVLLNAGATIYLAGISKNLESGVEMAKETLDSKKALDTLQKFIKCSNEG